MDEESFKSKLLLTQTKQYRNDTRVKDFTLPTKDELFMGSLLHSKDVQLIYTRFMVQSLSSDVFHHDYTKFVYIDLFHKAMSDKIDGKAFEENHWYKIHLKSEPHHAFDYKGTEKLDLTHIIHLCADWIAAGKSRSEDGKFDTKFISQKKDIKEILFLAFRNTLKKMDEMTEVYYSDAKYWEK